MASPRITRSSRLSTWASEHQVVTASAVQNPPRRETPTRLPLRRWPRTPDARDLAIRTCDATSRGSSGRNLSGSGRCQSRADVMWLKNCSSPMRGRNARHFCSIVSKWPEVARTPWNGRAKSEPSNLRLPSPAWRASATENGTRASCGGIGTRLGIPHYPRPPHPHPTYPHPVTFFVAVGESFLMVLACRARHDCCPQSLMIRGVLSPGLVGL